MTTMSFHHKLSRFFYIVSQSRTFLDLWFLPTRHPWHFGSFFYSVRFYCLEIVVSIVYFVELFFGFKDSPRTITFKIMAFVHLVVCWISMAIDHKLHIMCWNGIRESRTSFLSLRRSPFSFLRGREYFPHSLISKIKMPMSPIFQPPSNSFIKLKFTQSLRLQGRILLMFNNIESLRVGDLIYLHHLKPKLMFIKLSAIFFLFIAQPANPTK